MNIARSSLPTFKAKPGYTVNAAKTLEEFYVFMNTAVRADQEPAGPRGTARTPTTTATTSADILDGYGVEAGGPLPTGMACHVNITQPTYDLAKAKAAAGAGG